ncbi:hypothetical protein O5O45_09660 [Hahella aquimaris]|uniref:hypothetical protein n=1 Tax=Hahella sp. HNIBRBA332 TaxID=3015983 RepID=UPI00273ACFEF|nr:hypothetical protein [Hahella sp. HNIBRBA332]WLQ16180.1 hypothetical protein O5O45_09660 [Hahella sp. HNIBRBA332]
MKTTLISLAMGAAITVASSASYADVEGSASYLNHVITANGAAHYLPINLSFYASTTGTRAIFFNGECAVQSNDNFTWYNINIEVTSPSGVVTVIAPSNSDNAFCTGKGNGVLGNWSSNETHGTYYASTVGWYRVRVQGQLIGYGAGESVDMDDMSLIVMD